MKLLLAATAILACAQPMTHTQPIDTKPKSFVYDSTCPPLQTAHTLNRWYVAKPYLVYNKYTKEYAIAFTREFNKEKPFIYHAEHPNRTDTGYLAFVGWEYFRTKNTAAVDFKVIDDHNEREITGWAVRFKDSCSAKVFAEHIRIRNQRLFNEDAFYMAHADSLNKEQRKSDSLMDLHFKFEKVKQ
jgi:hypothetical protein